MELQRQKTEPIFMSIEEIIESADRIGQKVCRVEVSTFRWLQEPGYSGAPISSYLEIAKREPQILAGTLAGAGLEQMPRYGDTESLPIVLVNNVSVLRPDGSLVREIKGRVVVRADEVSDPLRLEFSSESETI